MASRKPRARCGSLGPRILGGLVLTAVWVGLLPLEGSSELVDRIVAVVDADVILESELGEAVWLYRAQMGLSPDDTTGLRQFRRQMLEQLIDEKVLVAKAQREGFTVGTKELAESLDLAVEEMRRSFGSEEAFQRELDKEGLTIQSVKDRYRDAVRQQILARRVMEQELRPKLVVTPDEVRGFYETHREEIPPIPERVHLLAALVRVEPTREAWEEARRRAVTVLGMIREGKDFAEAATEFSAGPEASRGGDIGYFRRGDLAHVPGFEAVAFSLPVGEVGGPVETRLGYHLLMTTAREEDRVRVSQILFLVKESGQDTLRARETAEEVQNALREGNALEEIRSQYAGVSNMKVETEDLGFVTVPDLKPYYREAVAELGEGETTDVLVIPEGLQVLRLVDRIPEHEATFEEVSAEIMDLVARRKMEEAYREWTQTLRKEIYIQVAGG